MIFRCFFVDFLIIIVVSIAVSPYDDISLYTIVGTKPRTAPIPDSRYCRNGILLYESRLIVNSAYCMVL